MSGTNKLLVTWILLRYILGGLEEVPDTADELERLFGVELLLVPLLDEKCDRKVGSEVVDQFHGA